MAQTLTWEEAQPKAKTTLSWEDAQAPADTTAIDSSISSIKAKKPRFQPDMTLMVRAPLLSTTAGARQNPAKLSDISDAIMAPSVTLGRDTTPQETVGMGPTGQSIIGAGEASKHFTESLTSPFNIATLGAGGALAKVYPYMARALSGAFGLMMAKQAAEEAGDLAGLPKDQRDPKTVAKHLTSIALSGGTAALAGYDAAVGERVKPMQGPLPQGSVMQMPPGARPAPPPGRADIPVDLPAAPIRQRDIQVPSTPPEPERGLTAVEEIRQRGLKTKAQIQAAFPQLTREQAGAFRDQAWGPPAQPAITVPPEIKALLPKAAAAAEAIEAPKPAEPATVEPQTGTKPEKEETNAGQISENAAVYGDVRPLEEPARQLPVEESQPGVQSQTGGGIRTPEGPRSPENPPGPVEAFTTLQARMSALAPSSPTFEKDFQEISGAMEAIKNRNKGFVPGTEPKEPANPAHPSGWNPPPTPETFGTIDDLLKYRSASRDSQIQFFKSLGLTDAQAQKMFRSVDARSNTDTSAIEAQMSPENLAKLEQFEREEGYTFDRKYDPTSLKEETDRKTLASNVVRAIQDGEMPTGIDDKSAFASISLRRLKEQGGTWSDIARELDRWTTANSGSQGDKAEYFKSLGQKLRVFAKSQGVDLQQGELGAKPGFKKQIGGIDRPNDIIDDVQNIIGLHGKISIANTANFDSDFKPTGAAKSLFGGTGGHKLDDVAGALRLQGINVQDEGHLLELIQRASEARKGQRFETGNLDKAATMEGNKLEAFQTDAAKGGPGKEAIDPDSLFVGGTFEINGEKFKIKAVETDAQGRVVSVTAEDGSKYGRQQFSADATINADAGTIKGAPATVTPKLAQGEKGTGNLFKGEDQPFNLAGQKGSDGERIAAEKAAAEQRAREAADLSAKQQPGLPGTSAKQTFESLDDIDASNLTPAQKVKARDAFLKSKGAKPPEAPPEAPGITSMGGLAPGDPQEPVGKGGSGNPDIYGIAARVREGRAKAGVAPAIPAGEGVTAAEAVQHGRSILSNDPTAAQKAAELFTGKKAVSYDGIAVVRAKGEESARAARNVEEKFGTDSEEYRNAFENAFQWDKISKGMQTEWSKQGKAQQGETDIDTGDFTSMQIAYKSATGKDFTPDQAAVAKEQVKKVRQARQEAQDAKETVFKKIDEELKYVQVPAAKTPDEARGIFASFETGKGMTPEQVKVLWEAAKKQIEAGNDDFNDIRHKLAIDFGISVEDVTKGLASPKGVSKLTDEMFVRQQTARRVQEASKWWIEQQTVPLVFRAIQRIPRLLFAAKVGAGLHGFVALGTHAPAVAGMPQYWKSYVKDFGKMYKMVAKRAYYEMQVQDLRRRPNYVTAQRAGLVNDPYKLENYADPHLSQRFGGLTDAGNRGYFVLKLLRQDMFDQQWNKLAPDMQIPEVAKAIAKDVNHSTGIVSTPVHPAIGMGLFAPRLELSRVAWLAADPAKAAVIFAKIASPKTFGEATPAERYFAMNQVKTKAAVTATLLTALAMNQGYLSATGSKQKVNMDDPLRADYLKFKVGGMNVAYGSSMLTMMRLPIELWHIRDSDGGKLKALIYQDESTYNALGSYGRTQLSPAAALFGDLWLKEDYMGRQLPNSTRPEPKRLRAQGITPYSWNEFWTETLAPIPIEDGLKEVWQGAYGMNVDEMSRARKALMTTAIMGGTGARLSDDTHMQK